MHDEEAGQTQTATGTARPAALQRGGTVEATAPASPIQIIATPAAATIETRLLMLLLEKRIRPLVRKMP